MRIIIIALVALVVLPPPVVGQEPRAYAGGTVNFVTATQPDDRPLGGTTFGGSVMFGIRVSPRVAIEVEPSFGGSYSWQYTYRPGPSLVATVVASRRETFFPVQARIRAGVLEPVVGVGIAHARIARHATLGATAYFDDSRSDNDLALVGGLDAAFKLASNVYFVPTLRVLVVPRESDSPDDPLGSQTSTGSLIFRYGVGTRVVF